ncbi:agmatine deiminase family protein [Patescibacteria group bacterium]|nr:agmatine deiminase family protein [Patescibacteria group bacterium]
MTKQKFSKKPFIIFALGIIVVLLVTEFVIPTIERRQIENRFLNTVKTAPIPLPYHSYTKDDIRELIGLLDPKVWNITDADLERVQTEIQKMYAPQWQAAYYGIDSDKAMVKFMTDSGLLEDMRLDKDKALRRLQAIDTTNYAFQARSVSTEYYPLDPPNTPVRYPGEYELIGAVFVSWPVYHLAEDWSVHLNLVSEIVTEAEAWILVPNEFWQKAVELYLIENQIELSNIKFFHVPINDIWARDFMPITVTTGINSDHVLIWNPYQPLGLRSLMHDNEASAVIGAYLNMPVHRLPIVIEGGNIITDGRGTILMMESVYENNPEVSREDLEKIMTDYFGASRLITFSAVPGEACGHVDMVTKFIDANTIMVAQVSEDHSWYNSLENIATTLAHTDSVNGTKYKIIRIPLPKTTHPVQEWTYLNSLTLNNKVIVPVYGVEEDEVALEAYRKAMPEHTVIGLNERNYGAGAVHCQTKEVPASFMR